MRLKEKAKAKKFNKKPEVGFEPTMTLFFVDRLQIGSNGPLWDSGEVCERIRTSSTTFRAHKFGSNVRLIRPSVERRRRHSEHREVPRINPAEAVSRASPPFTYVPRAKVLCSLAQQPALCHP